MMTVLIPLAPGTEPHPDTLTSIARQSVPCEVVTRSLPYRVRASQRMLRKRTNECDNRNALMPEASRPYAMYVDSDVVLAGPNDVCDCIVFLDNHRDLDAVALDTKHQDIRKAELRRHVCVACLMIRTEAWAGFQWTATVDQCSCMCVNEWMRVRYLDDRKLREAS